MMEFRPIESTDLPLLQTWRNSDEVRPYVREYRMLSLDDQYAWFRSYQALRRKSDWDQEILLILNNGVPIGVGGFTRIEWRNRRAELTLYFSRHDVPWWWNEAISRLIRIGFDQFNFHKITWPVYSHDPNLALYATLFDREAVLQEEYWWDGKWRDRVYFSIKNSS